MVLAPNSPMRPRAAASLERRGWKQALDILCIVMVLPFISPLMVLIGLWIKLVSRGPVVLRQQRIGRDGQLFFLYKFRTMRPTQRGLNEERLAHKSGDKIRTSVIGCLLRRLRLDELPQIFHIIVGTMSFVGPRPLLPDDQPMHGAIRLSVRPGVTGWAQIHGGDALTPEEKLVLDAWYIRHMSLWLDIIILLRTLIVVLKEDTPRRYGINALN